MFLPDTQTHLDDTCTFPEKKKNTRPSTLKYITLTGSAINTVFATSPKCIFKDSFKNCFDVELYNSDAIQQLSDDDQHCALCETRNLKIIIKLLGLMGDETRVVHQKKKKKSKKKSMMKSTMLEL